jgi:hypothetical protein
MAGFVKAERKRAKARIAITGPSGSGKSLSALLIAKGLGGKIAAIDTEHESLCLYASNQDLNTPAFDVQLLDAPYSPDKYIAMIHQAEHAGYDVIVIDSLTHEWTGSGGLLDMHEKIGGNSYTAWAKLTPKHQALIDAILQSPCHIIATMRSRQEYSQNEKDGKKTVNKLGMAPQQREGMDYEFTLCLDIQADSHVASASKSRTGKLWDGRYEKITEEHGNELLAWLEKGVEVVAPTHTVTPTVNVPAPIDVPAEPKAVKWLREQSVKAGYESLEDCCAKYDIDCKVLLTNDLLQRGLDKTLKDELAVKGGANE